MPEKPLTFEHLRAGLEATWVPYVFDYHGLPEASAELGDDGTIVVRAPSKGHSGWATVPLSSAELASSTVKAAVAVMEEAMKAIVAKLAEMPDHPERVITVTTVPIADEETSNA